MGSEEQKGSDWGKSLPVPSVQELVKTDPQSLLERYIQPHRDRPVDPDMAVAPSSFDIPIIDFALLAKGDEYETRKLDLACKDWGVFQIINHGVEEEVLLKINAAIAAFFELPLEEKNKYVQDGNDFQGYGLKRFYGKTKQAMRMNYYPPCPRPELVLGISHHSDPDIITLLLQDDEVPGLQIRHKDEWILVKPIRNAFVVNVGDVMEILSNGMYKSIEHRAITNETKVRLSVATFTIPSDELEMGPMACAVADDRPRLYGNIQYLDYLRYTLGRKMAGKAHLDNILKIKGNCL